MPQAGVPSTSLAAGASTANILAGNAFEFVGRAVIKAALVGSANGLTVTIVNGTQIVAQDAPVPMNAATIAPRYPDDYHFRWLASGRQQIYFKNPTGGAINYAAFLDIQFV